MQQDVWVKDSILHFEHTHTAIDTIANLTDEFVIPPFASAHNHQLESEH